MENGAPAEAGSVVTKMAALKISSVTNSQDGELLAHHHMRTVPTRRDRRQRENGGPGISSDQARVCCTRTSTTRLSEKMLETFHTCADPRDRPSGHNAATLAQGFP